MIKREKLNIKTNVNKHPKYLVIVSVLTALLIFGLVECVRARMYISNSKEFKNSASVLMLLDTADRLNKSVSTTAPAYYCKFDFEALSLQYNPAVADDATAQNSVESLVTEIQSRVITIESAPAFSSLLEFLPQPKNARAISVAMNSAITEVEILTSNDARSDYCLEMRDALVSMYFLQDLKRPEGVSALSVGQIENFQINLSNVREEFISLAFPSIFEKQHMNFLELLNKISVDLRQNENDYDLFARGIEQDVESLNTILKEIGDASNDLITKPTDIAIQLNNLRVTN